MQSLIISLQLYSDKSKISLKVSGLTFYPLDVNGINVSKIMQYFMSTHGNSILGSLPVQFFFVQHRKWRVHNNIERIGKLRNAYHVIAQVMNPLAEKVLYGIPCHKLVTPARLKIILGSFSAEITEQKQMICVKYSNLTKQTRVFM